jgi:outer membrane protein assembly factor BamB
VHPRCSFHLSLLASLVSLVMPPFHAEAQDDSVWHISPTQINIKVGESRPLQILDDHGQEIHSDQWSLDNPDLADLTVEDGRPVLHPKAVGVVNVAASLDGTVRTREVEIRPADSYFRGVHWAVPPLGRETDDLQAASTADGPDLFFLDQTVEATYVRALSHDGLQFWLWKLPEVARDVKFICGDNLGGAIVAAGYSDSYTLYVVSKDGKLLWHRRFEGVRKGHALNPNNVLHLLNQSSDGIRATIVALDGATGTEKFSLQFPASHENELNVTRIGDKIVCAPNRSASHTLRTLTSGLFVNTDGDAYAAFTQDDWTVGTDKCGVGAVVDPQKVYFSRDDKLVLWRIHSDGSYHATIVDGSKYRSSFAAPVTVMSPTGDIIPDGFGGVLLSVRWTHTDIPQKVKSSPDEFVYRITEDGTVAYKFPLPKYAGPLHDEMVLGEQDLGFATRGGMLIAFNVRDGSEVWRWDSGVRSITINMATAGGGCAVDTPEGLVLVEEGVKKRVLAPPGSQMYSPGEYIRRAN